MANEHTSLGDPLHIIFLSPRVYRPLKTNYGKMFELLSKKQCTGYIFTLSGSRHNLSLENFRFYAEKVGSNIVSRRLRALWIQVAIPLWLLWTTHIDVISAYDPYASGFAGVILKLFLRTKLIVEINGEDYLETAEPFLKKWIQQLFFALSIRFADTVKVLNRDQESFIRRYAPGKKVYRFSNFVATEYFQSLECYQGDYLLSVGYPFHLKGMDVLIQAFRRISHKHPAIKLRIMGYAPDEELATYKELAQHDPRIEFIKPGWIEDVGEQMRGCYALVHAARREAMGRVQLEAMACRKPVIATRTNGSLDYIQDGHTGLLCEIDNVEELAQKMDFLLAHPELALQMGQAGFQRLCAEFSEEHYINAFLTMAEEVVHQKQ